MGGGVTTPTPSHGRHKLYRCYKCQQLVTYQHVSDGVGCTRCGSNLFCHTRWAHDREVEGFIKTGDFDPNPDIWVKKVDE